MIEYEKILKPSKILSLTDDYEIYYVDETNNVKVFDAKKIENSYYKELIINNFDKVEIYADGFVWNFDDDDAFIGKDTISDYSKEITIEDFVNILNKQNQSKKISTKKLNQLLISLF